MYIRTQRALAVGVSGLMRIVMRRFSFSSPCFFFFYFAFSFSLLSKIKEESYTVYEQSPLLCRFSSSAVFALFCVSPIFSLLSPVSPHLLSYFPPPPLTEFTKESKKESREEHGLKKEKPGDEVAWHPHPCV